MLETMSGRELEEVAADEWLDYDIRIEAQAEIYRRQRSPEGNEYEGIQKERRYDLREHAEHHE